MAKEYKRLTGNNVLHISTNTSFTSGEGGNANDRYQDWLSQGNIPDPADVYVETWLDKRLKSIADGGYGAIAEQLEMIGEQGITAYQAHIALVKTNNSKIPKV